MRYYLDTEFLDDATTRTVELISIALVCEDGRELYLVNSEFDRSRADDWLNANVMPQLPKCVCPGGGALDHLGHTNPDCKWRTRTEMRDAIAAFVLVEPKENIEFWAYFASYDWLCLAQLFGKMIDLPKHFSWLVNDLKVWATHMGYTGKFRDLLPDTGHHDALADAKWNRNVHKLLRARRDQNRFTLVHKLLLDLNDRSGYSVDSETREMICPDWRKIVDEMDGTL
jgi:hypothetical protein